MDFVAIDFETANAKRASVCAVGLVDVRDGQIVDEYYTLVNPHDDFDRFCIAVHGITPDQVENSPSFTDIWPELRSRIENRILVAHNASFDMSVLRRSAEEHGLELPHIQYMCSCLMSRKIWPGMPNHKLNTVARELNLGAFKHHDAIEDARTAAKIFLRCSEAGNASDCSGLAERYGYRVGQILQDGSHVSFSSSAPKGIRSRKGPSAQTPNTKSAPYAPSDSADRNNPLYGKRIVFTGRMSGLKREEAYRRAAELGALCTESVEWKTDYVVIGRSDYAKYAAGGYITGKTQSAARLAAAGSRIRILSEDEFVGRLNEAAEEEHDG
ncbi:exonuclease domain-containing protein [Saccharibacillus kuerlensis]|uniref:DNA polymerase III subunit epsilon n=1 Tax=Saccharibacillus kuerlensis TaxID=459527 RepID=A0ABQ2L028_9BACL|nr:exonuclease domain-containing protein [Saccharibacillus kuerlensis]GGN98372.1 DNA polymerase III subunit epsilon [Saccharibacillus kuerlensis]